MNFFFLLLWLSLSFRRGILLSLSFSLPLSVSLFPLILLVSLFLRHWMQTNLPFLSAASNVNPKPGGLLWWKKQSFCCRLHLCLSTCAVCHYQNQGWGMAGDMLVSPSLSLSLSLSLSSLSPSLSLSLSLSPSLSLSFSLSLSLSLSPKLVSLLFFTVTPVSVLDGLL